MEAAMPDHKRYITAGGTFAVILMIGFVMQNGQSSAPQVSTNAIDAPAEPMEIAQGALTSASLETPQPADTIPATPVSAPAETPIAPTPVAAPADADTDKAPVETASLVDAPASSGLPRMNAALDMPGAPTDGPGTLEAPKAQADCAVAMTAETMAAALVKLNLSAPCLPNERVTMHHNGMMFSEATDADGALEIMVPALTETAVFIASFADGKGAVANAKVSSLEFYDRAVVQSDSESSVSLHALEFGADYDDKGHVWTQAAGTITDAATGKGGFLISLGNPEVADALMAEVYTFPSGIAENDGDIELSVEIEVTAMNCGRDIEAQSLETGKDGKLSVQALELTMPDCDAIGDFLVLKNLVNDLKVARN
jgi:hypothetical protein